MDVNAGTLNKRIEIYRGKYFTPPEKEELVHSCWARFSQTSGTELVKNNADWGEVKVRFLIRHTKKALDRKMFVRYCDADYHIEYINTYGDNRQYIEIWCKAGSVRRGVV